MFYIMLASRFLININIMITAAGHGKDIVDALSGCDKRFLEQLMNVVGRGYTQDVARDLSNATVDPDGDIAKVAAACAHALNDPRRQEASDKRKRKHGQAFISKRSYVALDHSSEERLMKDTVWEIREGMPEDDPADKKVTRTVNGLGHFHHFYTSSHIYNTPRFYCFIFCSILVI